MTSTRNKIVINWNEIWDEFNKWMCSQQLVLDVRKWDFENSDLAKAIIRELVEGQLNADPNDPNEVKK